MIHLDQTKNTIFQRNLTRLQKMNVGYVRDGYKITIRGVYEWTFPKITVLNLVNKKRLSARVWDIMDSIKHFESEIGEKLSPSNYREFEKTYYRTKATDYKGSEEHKQDLLLQQQERDSKQKNIKIKKDQMVKDFAQQLINKGLKPDVTSSSVKYRGYKYQVRMVYNYELEEEMTINGKPWKKSRKLFIKEILNSKIIPSVDQEAENSKMILDLLEKKGYNVEKTSEANKYKYKNILFYSTTTKFYDGGTKSHGEGLSNLISAMENAKTNWGSQND